MICTYHISRNFVLHKILSRLSPLFQRTEDIWRRTMESEDGTYNASIARLQEIAESSWEQQVIAAEAMKYDFGFLSAIWSFWKKIVCAEKAARQEKEKKKPGRKPKAKPTTEKDTGPPKRSGRLRNSVVTYDEDVLEHCVTSGVGKTNNVPPDATMIKSEPGDLESSEVKEEPTDPAEDPEPSQATAS